MKKVVGLLICLYISWIFLGCDLSQGNNIQEHQHSFSTEWTTDKNNHWHKATCEHENEVSGKDEHLFTDWDITVTPTEEEDGEKVRSCIICEYEESEVIEKTVHEHSYFDCWIYDKEDHWHQTTCCDSIIEDKAAHSWNEGVVLKTASRASKGEKLLTCTVCEYEKKVEIPAFWLEMKATEFNKAIGTAVTKITANETSEFGITKSEDGTIVNVYGVYITNVYSGDLKFPASLEYADLRGIDTSNLFSAFCMFSNCENLIEVNLSNFDTSNITDMSSMFKSCKKLQNLDLSSFNTSKVKNMEIMFNNCENLETLDITSFDTANVTNMMQMFCHCFKLKEIDVSGFNTSNVTNMFEMFTCCQELEKLDVSGFDTSKVTDMTLMFGYCKKIKTLDVSKFDTSNVTNMFEMFTYCFELEDLNVTSFDTSKVTNMRGMFCRCYLLDNLDLSSFNTQNVSKYTSMLSLVDNNETRTVKINSNIWSLTDYDTLSSSTTLVVNDIALAE